MATDPDGIPPHVVVMGVAGSGKSTVGALLAIDLGVPFVDGDSLHPAANVAKMSAGIPLTDADRQPWLETVGDRLARATGGEVIACSALRRAYRDTIRSRCPSAVFVLLDGTPELLAERMNARHGHFMPPSLLRSQLDLLERLQSDERGFALDIAAAPERLAADAARELHDLLGRTV